MAAGHESRAHALLGPSGVHRWSTCTLSAQLETLFPDTTSDAAAEGTIAHELCEGKLKAKFFPESYSSRKLSSLKTKLKKAELWSDDMEGYTNLYADEIYKLWMGFDSEPTVKVEEMVDLSAYIPDGFGTADCILIGTDRIEVVDFKYGKGVAVDAYKNPQMMLYALGAYEAYKLFLDVKKVGMTIVQPRLDSVSHYECNLSELLEFGEWIKGRAELAYKGEGEYAPSAEACRFCRAKQQCRARAEANLELVKEANLELVKEAFSLPPLLSDEEVGEILEKGSDYVKWIKDLEEYALSASLNGHDIKGWKAVEGRSSRTWTDQDAAFAAIEAAGTDAALLWERKPLTLAAVEKVLGKKAFSEVAGSFVTKTVGKPTLVRDTDKRPAITNKTTAEEAFG